MLLLNSDVEVRDPRWLRALLDAHRGGASGLGLQTDEAGPRTDGYALLVDRELYRRHRLDESYPGWWCVAKLQAELLAAGAPVTAISDHDHMLFHFGQKSGPALAQAPGAGTHPHTVRGWYGSRRPSIVAASELLPRRGAVPGRAPLSRRGRALARIEDRLERLSAKADWLLLGVPERLDRVEATLAELAAEDRRGRAIDAEGDVRS